MRKEASFGSTTRKRGRMAGLPIVGLMLAITLAIVSYFAAPPLLSLVGDQFPQFGNQLDTWPNEKPSGALPDNLPDYVAGLALWLIMMGVAMFLVSATVGPDPERESWQHMGPPPADKKKVVKQLKKDMKVAKQRERDMKKRRKA